MEISEKVAYLKGLAEGLALDTETKEGKLIAAIIDVLDEMSIRFEDIDDNLVDLEDGLDAVSDDLSEVEEALYEMGRGRRGAGRRRRVLRDHLPCLPGGDRL